MLEIKLFTFNPVQENTYVIFNDTGACCIIDPGCYFEDEYKELTEFINSRKLLPKCLLNTHCHLDHVFGNKRIAELYDLTLHIHPNEEIMLKYAPEYGIKWGLPFENYEGKLEFLSENTDFPIGNDRLRLLPTPGHSPGHLSFYSEADKFVISGDALFRESIGRTDLPYADTATLLKSIRQQLFTLPDEVKVYPGHGPHTTIGFEKQNNPFLH